MNPNTNVPQKYGSKKDADHRNGSTGSHQKKGGVTSYVSVVNGVTPLVQPGNSLSSAPALVLDEECVVERDFSNGAMGRVKSYDSFTKCYNPFSWERDSCECYIVLSWRLVGYEVNQDLSSDERVDDKELNKEFSPTKSAKVMNHFFKWAKKMVTFNSVGEMEVGNNNRGICFGIRQGLMSELDDLKEMEEWISSRKQKSDGRLKDPILVKKAFKDHYEARFNKPTKARLKLSFSFPNRLSTDQAYDSVRWDFLIASLRLLDIRFELGVLGLEVFLILRKA
ncbi:hypothetical protein Tco_1033725 [Tanacetum coccineum]